jgi:hypothetical protein
MNCEETLALLDGYFNNELDLAKTIAIEEHLRSCASCRSQYELRIALRDRLKDPDLRYAIPKDFAQQIRNIRSLIGTHLIDVESSDQHTVKPWFAGKVDFSPPVRDFADQGFKLVGGRLDYVRGNNVAVLVYRFENHYVSLFICRERTPEAASKQKSFDYQSYNLVYWNANGLDCWAVSDIAPAALLEFVKIQQAEHS